MAREGRGTLSLCQGLECGSDGGETRVLEKKKCGSQTCQTQAFIFSDCFASTLLDVPSFTVFHFLSPGGFKEVAHMFDGGQTRHTGRGTDLWLMKI